MRMYSSVPEEYLSSSRLVMAALPVGGLKTAQHSFPHFPRVVLCAHSLLHQFDLHLIRISSSMTSVGATTNIPETAASFSSGGFSNVFPRPKYQAQAVSSYLSKIRNTDQGKFNTSGRAYPDVSTQGVNFGIFVDSQFGLVSGTSCSSPLFASMIALINGELVARGKSPLGFLNPFLYGPALGAGAFNDIMTGSNPGCDTQGFPAESG